MVLLLVVEGIPGTLWALQWIPLFLTPGVRGHPCCWDFVTSVEFTETPLNFVEVIEFQ